MEISNRSFYGMRAVGFHYGMERTRTNTAGSFARQAAEAAQAAGKATATLHGADERTGDIAVGSWADVVNGSSMSVYRTQNYDLENPVYKVKIWDSSGNVTERMVDVSKVDPQNCDTAEMYAYTSHLKESGKGSFEDTVLKAAVAKAAKSAEQKGAGTFSFSQKVDWLKLTDDMMQSAYRCGDLKGYMEWKSFLGILEEKHAAGTAATPVAGHHEKAFESVGPNAPKEVKNAGWKRQRKSALNAAKKVLYALENPLRPTGQRSPEVQQMVKKEKEFYKVFISKLSGLSNG